ncbi:XrtA/PEP-CTERM system exopolysaccharide export protein [Motilimonas pumila]|uniref:Sugar ABC transporter substrate-binding protein n=1 Tax=Motilimonas pumila TaxID=2303987 RepID=A0A418YH88_9GAMM|nr:XrtA/PEP-CTERM system exopolysaccharide export protein [Motilimonas pumila]RJG49466.1 sugar ABC transporter substrate-binding protein [Motilimonas pumila]
MESILKSPIWPIFCLMLFVSACSQNDAPVASSASFTASSTADPEEYKYLIGPGDILNIFVWRNPEISGSFTVRPDGMITTSLVEDIPVTGKTPTELAREIEDVLSTYLREPIVTVTVSGFTGPYTEQVRIIGEASSPQALNYSQYMTVLDVMIQVGGLTEFADGNNTSLVRIENGQQKKYRVRLDDLVRKGDITANTNMLPGDILIIPEAWF